MKTNIPIHRARKIDSDEYIVGYLMPQNLSGSSTIAKADKYFTLECFEIDISTLSIHFHNMLDSDGKKIFASLSEDWKGGDLLEDNSSTLHANYVVLFKDLKIRIRDIDGKHAHYHGKNGTAPYGYLSKKSTKVVGIQQ